MRMAIGMALMALAGCSDTGGQSGNESVANDPRAVAPSPAPATPAAALPFESRFTTGGIERCKVIDKNEEEGPYYRHLCPGIGGYMYEIVESDLRQHLVIIGPDKTRSELSTYPVGGGGFNVLGATMDWRGRRGEPPRTLTARLDVQDGETGKNVSYLMVIRLAAPSCIVGTIEPGPDQNDKARAITDRADLPACVSEPQ